MQFGRMTHEEVHHAKQGVHSFVAASRWSGAADQRHACQAFWQGIGYGRRVRAPAGMASNGKLGDGKGIGQLGDVVGPVEEGAVRLEVGTAVAGAIRCNDPYAQLLGSFVQNRRFQTGIIAAVKEKERPAGKIAIFGIGQDTAVGKRYGLGCWIRWGPCFCAYNATSSTTDTVLGMKLMIIAESVREGKNGA